MKKRSFVREKCYGGSFLGFLLLVVLCLAALTLPNKGLTMVAEIPLADLVNGASLIIIANVEDVVSNTFQITATVTVEGAPLKGSASGTLTVISGPILMYDASFTRVPERVILFLVPDGPNYRTYWRGQGKYTSESGQVLELGISETQFISDINQILNP